MSVSEKFLSVVVLILAMVILALKLSTPKPTPIPKVEVVNHNQFIRDTMAIVNVKSSQTQQDIMVAMLERVTKKVFGDNKEAGEGFITLVAMESGFNPKAKSHAGAVGLAQVIPKYAQEFAGHCGLIINPEDVQEPEINLTLGACLFRHLREKYNNVSLALVAYNAGAFSKQIKDMKSMRSLSNLETAGYVAKYHYLQEIARNGR